MVEPMTNVTWKRSDDWVGTEVDGSFVMVDVETGKYVALNETALAIWKALETSHSTESLSHYLGERFEVEAADDFDAHVSRALATLHEMRLIQRSE